MKRSAYFKRVSEKTATAVATQVTVGILDETKSSIQNTLKVLAEKVAPEQLGSVYAEIEENLRSKGINVKLTKGR